MRVTVAITLVATLCALVHGMSNIKEHGRKILLKSGTIDTTTAAPFNRHSSEHLLTETHKAAWATELPSRAPYMIHVSHVDVKSQLEAVMGSSIKTYLPHNTYLVHASPQQIEELNQVQGVVWTDAFPSIAKVDADTITKLKNEGADTISFRGEKKAVVPENLMLSTFYDVQHTEQWQHELNAKFPLEDMSIVVTHVSARKVAVAVRPTAGSELAFRSRASLQGMFSTLQQVVHYMADKPEVSWIQLKRQPVLKNKYSRWVIQTQDNDVPASGSTFQTPLYNAGIDGSGVIVGCGDTGLDYTHCHFVDGAHSSPGPSHRKVYHYEQYVDGTDYMGGHGTHVSGSITASAEDGITQADFNGQAPGAKIWFFDIGDSEGSLNIPNDLYTSYFQPNFDDDVQIHSNSWGCGLGQTDPPTYCNTYDQEAVDIDDFTATVGDFLIMVAAGNDGDTSIYGNIGTPATAKNIMAVGATSNTWTSWDDYTGGYADVALIDYNSEESMAYFSSTGPNTDGRLGPMITAPGYFIMSTNSSGPNGVITCSTLTEAGTSMATPTTAGSAVLVQQYYQDGFYPMGTSIEDNRFRPTASLMKATLINGATPMVGVQKNAYYVDVFPYLIQYSTLSTTSAGGVTYNVITNGQTFGASLTADQITRFKAVGGGSSYIHVTVQNLVGSQQGDIGDCDIYVSTDPTFATTSQYSYQAGTEFEYLSWATSGGSTLYIQVYAYVTTQYAVIVEMNDDPNNDHAVPNLDCSDYFVDGPYSVINCPTTCTTSGVGGDRIYDGTGPICATARHNGVISGDGITGSTYDYFYIDMQVWSYGPGVTLGPSTANGVTSAAYSFVDGDIAIIMNVGTPYYADVFSTGFNDDTPNMFSGYGRVDLSSVLRIAGVTPTRDFDILTNRNDDSITTGVTNTYCFTASSASLPVKVTLVWTDPAASVSSSIQLVNDLDLTVTTDSCSSSSDDDVWLGNNGASADTLNNVEQVVILNPGTGCNFCAAVIGSNVPSGPQTYSLVASSAGTLAQTGDTDIFASSGTPCIGCGSPDPQNPGGGLGAGTMVSSTMAVLVAGIAAAYVFARMM
jgi:hypothetical protein